MDEGKVIGFSVLSGSDWGGSDALCKRMTESQTTEGRARGNSAPLHLHLLEIHLSLKQKPQWSFGQIQAAFILPHRC